MKRILLACVAAMLLAVPTISGCGGGDGTTGGGGGGGVGVFLSQLMVLPDGVFTNQSSTVTARVTLDASADSVVLEKMNSADANSATVVEELGTMFDDGDATAHGDDISGDNVYSALVTVNETTPGFLYVRANADGNLSDIVTVGVHEDIDATKWTDMTQTIPTAVQNYYDANGAAATADYINAGNIAGLQAGLAGVSKDGQGVWYVYDNGVVGGVVPTEPSAPDALSGDPLNKKGGSPRGEPEVTLATNPAMPMAKIKDEWAVSFAKAAETVDPNAIKSKSALYLGPYLWDFGANDDYSGAWALVKNSVCPKFDTTEVKNDAAADQNVTPEHFKTLSKYGIVVISTHGDNWYNGLFSLWDDVWGNKAATEPGFLNWLYTDDSMPVLLTGYKATAANKDTYKNDLLWHRLAITSSGKFAITPRFISYYNQTFPESIVYVSACRSAWNSKLADAFTAKGAGAFIGYNEYVYAGWAKRHGAAIFGPDPLGNVVNSMLPLTDPPTKATVQNIKNAYDDSVSKYGLTTRTSAPFGSQADTNGAYDAADPEETTIMLYPSASDKNLNVPAILNGDFEEGSAIGWESSGDYRVLAALGDVSPTGGTYMGVITTGLGTYGTQLTESVLKQSMCIPAKATKIDYQFDFITEEAMCYVNEGFDDTFIVELLDENSAVVATGSRESVDSSSWTFLGGDYFSGGDDYSNPQTCEDPDGFKIYDDGTYHTGWKSGSIDVSTQAGNAKPYTLQFRVYDQGDSIWDSAATVDDVSIDIQE